MGGFAIASPLIVGQTTEDEITQLWTQTADSDEINSTLGGEYWFKKKKK